MVVSFTSVDTSCQAIETQATVHSAKGFCPVPKCEAQRLPSLSNSLEPPVAILPPVVKPQRITFKPST